MLGSSPVAGGLLTVLGVAAALYSWWASEKKDQRYENFMEAQAALLAQGGLGNAFTKSVKNELDKGEWVKDGIARLRRALELSPEDVETLELFSVTLALSLSFRRWVMEDSLDPEFNELLGEARRQAEKGHELAPKSHILLDSLGVLSDLAGEHEQARKFFQHAGEIMQGSYWRLHASTSWGMEGEHERALAEIESAVEEGAYGWLVDFYRGRVLNRLGRYDEAFPYLHRAFEARGRRPELLRELMTAANFSGHAIVAEKYEWLLGLSMLRDSPRRGAVELLKSITPIPIYALCVLSKKLWPYTQYKPVIGRLHAKLLPPDEPESTILYNLAESEQYGAALVLARRALNIRPGKPENYQVVAVLLANVGNREEARAVCDRALEHWPNHKSLRGIREAVSQRQYVFRCVKVQGAGHGWVVDVEKWRELPPGEG